MGIIYIAINIYNGKYYIGQSCNSLEKRKAQHLNQVKYGHKDTYFYRAIRKYGADGFVWRILDTEDNREALNLLEMEYIELFQSAIPGIGYNSNLGGKGNKMTAEIREKISFANKGRPCSDARRRKISMAQKGRTIKTETREKIRKTMLGRKHTAEARSHMFGHKISDETREKMKTAGRKRKYPEPRPVDACCSLCSSKFIAGSASGKFCFSCSSYFTVPQRTKLLKKLHSGEDIDFHLKWKFHPVIGEGRCVKFCAECGRNFRAPFSCYVRCPLCSKEQKQYTDKISE